MALANPSCYSIDTMRCPHCDYLLFNLTTPMCPECGRGYRLEWYRFPRGAVSFHCPHCDQQYYGNDARGLPHPRSFECVQCHQPIELEQLRVVPEQDGVEGELAIATPWEQRRQRGTLKAWWATVGMLLSRPTTFFQQQSNWSISEAWQFALLCQYAGLIPGLTLQFAIQFLLLNAAGAPGLGGAPVLGMIIGMVLYMLIAPLIGTILGAVIQGAFYHLGLAVLAPDRRTYSHTVCVILYAMAPMVLMAIPFCGAYVAAVWIVVLAVIGLREVHRTTTGRAVLAVIWPGLLALGIVAAALAVYLLGNA